LVAPEPNTLATPARPGRRWPLAGLVVLGLVAVVAARRCLPARAPSATIAPPATSVEAAQVGLSGRRGPVAGASPSAPSAGTCAAGATCGFVVDDAGKPIAEAEVTVGRRGAVLAERTTDERGGFVLGPELSLDEGTIWLTAAASGFVPSTHQERELPLDDGPLILRLERGAVLIGRVVRDDTGEPVAGAEVMATPGAAYDDSDVPTTTTDAEGRFRLEGLAEGPCKPTARALGLFAQGPWVRLGPGVEAPPVVLRMTRLPSVSGRLVFAPGDQPCVQGEVTLRSKILPWQSAESDALGRITFPALLPGSYEVTLSCDDHVDEETAPPLVVDANDHDRAVVFALHEKLVIRGIVVDPAGAPVIGVDVGCRTSTPTTASAEDADLPTNVSAARTGLDGRFVLRDLEPGAYEVALVDGFANPAVRTSVGRQVPAPEVRLVWDKVRLRGRVVDEAGKPVADASVHLTHGQSEDGGLGTDVDENGRFETEHFGAGSVRIRAQLAGEKVAIVSGADDGSVEVTLPQNDGELVLVLRVPTGTIEGTVSGGETRGEIEVWAECSEPNAPAVPPLVDENGRPALHRENRRTSYASAKVGDDGRFVLHHLVPGFVCEVHARTADGESASEKGIAVGAHLDLPLRRAGKMHGTLDAGATSLGAFFTVSARFSTLPGPLRSERFIGTNGAWSLQGLPAAKYVVEVETPDAHGQATVELAPGDDREVRLTLQPGNGDDGGDE
jgi:hypothetical protein